MTDGFDDGFEFHRLKPDLLLADVWHAAERYAQPFPQYPFQLHLARAFVEGYQAARRQHEEAAAERAKPDASGHCPGGYAMPWIGDKESE